MTFSIIGLCPDTGQLGVAISSSSIAVGARCPWLKPGVGAVSTQNITLPSLGPAILDLLAAGAARGRPWSRRSMPTPGASTGRSRSSTRKDAPRPSPAPAPWACITSSRRKTVSPRATC